MHIQHAHIRTVHLHLHKQPRQVAATLGEFLRSSDDTPGTGAMVQGQAISALPRIAQPWAGVDGIYVGVSRGEDESEPDAHLVLLNATPGKRLPHPEAQAWAQALGDGAHLPSKSEGALLYAHLRELLLAERWIWLREQLRRFQRLVSVLLLRLPVQLRLVCRGWSSGSLQISASSLEHFLS